MMATFYTSDLHFGHRLLAGMRGFGTVTEEWDVIAGEPTKVRTTRVSPEQVAEHDEAVIANWNSVVKPGDTVWVLGDLTLTLEPQELLLRTQRLHGTKHLILGNHDAAHPLHRGWQNHQHDYWHSVFETVSTEGTVRLEGQLVMLSHFPYTGDRGQDRAKQFRLRDYGAPIIHGHTHKPEKLSRSEQGSLQIHVGLDAHGLKPVSETWVMRMLREDKVDAAGPSNVDSAANAAAAGPLSFRGG